jgi:hypothetical protein
VAQRPTGAPTMRESDKRDSGKSLSIIGNQPGRTCHPIGVDHHIQWGAVTLPRACFDLAVASVSFRCATALAAFAPALL